MNSNPYTLIKCKSIKVFDTFLLCGKGSKECKKRNANLSKDTHGTKWFF